MVFKLLLLFLPVYGFSEVGYVQPWGKDEKLTELSPSIEKKNPLSPIGIIAEKMILLHHNYITHISGPRSHFRPTSSQYMLEAIRSFGFAKGYLMGCDRLLRENGDPWVYRSKVIKDQKWKWDPPQ